MQHRFTVTLLCGLLWTAAAPADESPWGVLTLADGQTLRGTLRAGDAAGVVGWQGLEFTQPFAFPIRAISSIAFPAEQSPVDNRGEFAFELAGGDRLTGQIADWADDAVLVESPHFGKITVDRGAVQRLYRLGGDPALVYSGPSGMVGWQAHGGEWKEDGPHVWTSEPEAMLAADVELPEQAVIEFELSWQSAPDFVLAIGVDPSSRTDSRRDGWRFETWKRRNQNRQSSGVTLAIAREQSLADVAAVQQLSGEDRRLHLIAYLDQVAGIMQVFHLNGSPAGAINVPPPKAADAPPASQPATGVRLINRTGDVRLERLQIRAWNGLPPTAFAEGMSQFELADGSVVSGEVVGFDAGSQQFSLRPADNAAGQVPVSAERIVAAIFSTPPVLPSDAGDAATPGPGRETSKQKPKAGGQPSQGGAATMDSVSVVLQDGTRVSGGDIEIRERDVVIASTLIREPLEVSHHVLRALTFRDEPNATEVPKPAGRIGRLELADHRLSGALVSATEYGAARSLVWHPVGSFTGSPLRPAASGRIVYRDRPKPATTPTPQHGTVTPRSNRKFGKLFLQKATRPAARSAADASHTIHLRSGDAIPCTITAIDEAGVHISSPVAESQFLLHERIKAADLVTGGSLPDLQAAKKERLLTVPRLQKASPPTHLLCSRNGDFLRCRLMAMNDRTFRIELQLSERDVPRERVAQIIWFHPDESPQPEGRSDDSPAAADSRQPVPSSSHPQNEVQAQVQVVQSNGDRVTFQPGEVDDKFIAGTSDVLGACRFEVARIDQLLFGEQIEAAAAQLAYHQWRLRPAVEPLVAQDLDEPGGLAGRASPLVGQPAPDIELELLDGGRFRLTACRGQIVVLDFWASWCGPCMQTLPLLHEGLREFESERVRMIAVNLEESASHIRAVLERHQLSLTVALDLDGVAGLRYQASAIPQLVLIDSEGTVARVYIGGGQNVVEQTRAAIAEMLDAQ